MVNEEEKGRRRERIKDHCVRLKRGPADTFGTWPECHPCAGHARALRKDSIGNCFKLFPGIRRNPNPVASRHLIQSKTRCVGASRLYPFRHYLPSSVISLCRLYTIKINQISKLHSLKELTQLAFPLKIPRISCPCRFDPDLRHQLNQYVGPIGLSAKEATFLPTVTVL